MIYRGGEMNQSCCVMCLVIPSVSVEHKIRNPQTVSEESWSQLYRDHHIEPYYRGGGPREIVNWHGAIMEASGGDARFSLGPMDDTLTGFAVYQGTLLCVGHLWEILAAPPSVQPPRIARPRRF